MAQLVGNVWQDCLNGIPDGALPIRDHSPNGHVDHLLHFTSQICQIGFTRT